ncbi:gluconate operon transcriptional repressor GntR [Pectobacterium sp. A5351]|uniref:gluconate operon transcriptional repressor GntR n=1 Tax=Pectobacterium sp. A5351 TaxID=2914983 RepID=UPI00232B0B5A|nr:gluconate operon transcriptional repressor GntR [Pectobacterium sp. A5351]WCG82843.1 gluconate operon transcriptional repressor GntR [Pectobacterium sp. A5351]
MKKKRPVLQDVADRVGITKMTVSRYLRNPAQVSAALQEKIAIALDELGYIPNLAPNMLASSTSRAIGVLLPSLTNQVFAEVLRGIEHTAEAHGYQTMLAHYGYHPDREEQRLTSLLSYHIDGLILAERTHTPRTRQMLDVAGIPVVELMDSVSPCLDMAVGFDNVEAARQMTLRMVALGHSHIVYLGARQDERTIMRCRGYEQAMWESGLKSYCVMSERASSYSLGGELLRQTQEEYPQVDSVFCTNDDLAVGAMFECQRQGLRVPEDIGVAGFHGHDIGQAMVPKLASVLTPREHMGRVGTERLLARLRGEPVSLDMIDVGFTLLDGESL